MKMLRNFHRWAAFGCAAAAAGLLLQGCGASAPTTPRGSKYQYTYALSYPAESPSLTFKDDSVSMRFRIDDAAISFGVENNARSSLAIDWTKATIGINRVFTNVRNNSNFYGDVNDQPMSAVIPPKGVHVNLAIPVDNIVYSRGKWVERDLLPTMDGNSDARREEIIDNIGKSVILTLPMKFGTTEKEYTFMFRVADVKTINWKDYKAPKRATLPVRRKTSQYDQVTTAIVTVGVLGFTAFLLNTSKSPRTD